MQSYTLKMEMERQICDDTDGTETCCRSYSSGAIAFQLEHVHSVVDSTPIVVKLDISC